MNVDSIDINIARLLAKDAQQNSETLAKKLELSAATVRRRIKRLIDNRLLRIIGVVDTDKFGLPLACMITARVSYNKLEEAINTLDNKPEIRWVSTCTGRYDLIMLGRFESNDHLSSFIKKELGGLEGLIDSETFICLDMNEGRYFPLT